MHCVLSTVYWVLIPLTADFRPQVRRRGEHPGPPLRPGPTSGAGTIRRPRVPATAPTAPAGPTPAPDARPPRPASFAGRRPGHSGRPRLAAPGRPTPGPGPPAVSGRV